LVFPASYLAIGSAINCDKVLDAGYLISFVKEHSNLVIGAPVRVGKAYVN
jgi:hypothetical protein